MRYYSSVAGEMILVSSVTASDTTVELDTAVGLPASTPFTLILDYGELAEEVVSATAVSGNTVTITRGQDGTSKKAHAAGAAVRHGVTARDLRESREHEAATSAHGAVGDLVSVNASQTLKNKTISGSANTLTNIGKSSIPSDTVYAGATQTLTNKTLTSPTLSSPSVSGTQTGGKVAASNLTGSSTDTVAPYNYRVASGPNGLPNQTWQRVAPLIIGTDQAGGHGEWNYGNGEWTIPVSGRYAIDCGVLFDAKPGGQRIMKVERDDGLTLLRVNRDDVGNSNIYLNGSKQLVFQAGDKINFQMYQSSGGGLQMLSSDAGTYFSIAYLGAA